MRGFALTQGAMGPLGQSCKRFGFVGTRASRRLGGHERLATGSGGGGPQPAEHEEDAHQSHEPELVDKEGWYHGNVPAEDGAMGALYRI